MQGLGLFVLHLLPGNEEKLRKEDLKLFTKRIIFDIVT